ncbi:MAG: GNAT family N-acetyltransferase [Anaerolineae bacterium]|nr:GNAT family N-acetyltransferase [Anaerolineae bacterium]
MTTLETERLILREFEESDLQAIQEYASDPKVVRYMGWGPNSEEDTRAFLKRAFEQRSKQPRVEYGLAIILKTENRPIGSGGITIDNPDHKEAELGYCFNRRFWGQGYATEAARAFIAFGFEELGLHRIYATCDPANVASARVMEKIGMQREGHLREHRWRKGRWRDSYLYAILEQEWNREPCEG